MNSAASFSTPPEEEGPCGDWTYHEWAEAFSTNDLARSLPPGHIAVCRVQTGGRGRFNRKWIGEEGGLWASFTVPLSAQAFQVCGENGQWMQGSGKWTLYAAFGQPDPRTEELTGKKAASVVIE